jgi:hypothetical protein
MTRAAIHAQEGRPDLALAELERGERRIAAADAAIYASIVRYCRGLLVGGDEGKELRARAVQHLVSEGVKSPQRYIAWFLPGFGVPESD